MSKTVDLFEIGPIDPENEESDYYIGLSFDHVFQICQLQNGEPVEIGRLYTSDYPSMQKPEASYVEWVEIHPKYREQGYFSQAFRAMKQKWPVIFGEACNEVELRKYEHLGHTHIGPSLATGLPRVIWSRLGRLEDVAEAVSWRPGWENYAESIAALYSKQNEYSI